MTGKKNVFDLWSYNMRRICDFWKYYIFIIILAQGVSVLNIDDCYAIPLSHLLRLLLVVFLLLKHFASWPPDWSTDCPTVPLQSFCSCFFLFLALSSECMSVQCFAELEERNPNPSVPVSIWVLWMPRKFLGQIRSEALCRVCHFADLPMVCIHVYLSKMDSLACGKSVV